MNEFAVIIGQHSKIVFSRTLKSVEWKTARLAKGDLKEEVLALSNRQAKIF
jgi:dihydrofolate reductase